LEAIHLACVNLPNWSSDKVVIFSDCKSALAAIQYGWAHKEKLVRKVVESACSLNNNVVIAMQWLKSHSGIDDAESDHLLAVQAKSK
jgi:ribonuclease HI